MFGSAHVFGLFKIKEKMKNKSFQPEKMQLSSFGRNEGVILGNYSKLVKQKILQEDKRQKSLVQGLSNLQKILSVYTPPHSSTLTTEELIWRRRDNSSPLQIITGNSTKLKTVLVSAERIPRGVYIWGGVGTGKSMLLNLFFETCPTPNNRKRRVHFHGFMLEVHNRLHSWKKKDLAQHGRCSHITLDPERDAVKQVAKEIALETWVLCFDEFQVTDIVDAIIISRLFRELFMQGTVVVATSNRPPRDLYKGGLNRHDFLPFIELLKTHCIVFSMQSNIDYRLINSSNRTLGQFYWPANIQTQAQLDQLFSQLCGAPEMTTLQVSPSRKLECTRVSGAVCRFSFSELCEAEVGVADYKAICSNFSTIIIEDIPILSLQNHNIARRFILLIDELYEAGVVLICSSAAAPDNLFQKDAKNSAISSVVAVESPGGDAAQLLNLNEGELASVKELEFAFCRARSRLNELCVITNLMEEFNNEQNKRMQ